MDQVDRTRRNLTTVTLLIVLCVADAVTQMRPTLAPGCPAELVETQYLAEGARQHRWNLHVADVDGDGLDDFVNIRPNDYYSDSTSFIRIWRSDGSYTLPSPDHVEATSFGGRSLVVDDFNGDGAVDLLAMGRRVNGPLPDDDEYTMVMMLNNGTGAFSAQMTIDPALYGGYHKDVAIGDFDSDGFQDVIVLARGGEIRMLLNNRDGSLRLWQTLDTDRSFTDLAVGDIDGDGDIDVWAMNGVYRRSGERPALYVYENHRGLSMDRETRLFHGRTGNQFLDELILDDFDLDGELDYAILRRELEGDRGWYHYLDVKFNNGDGEFPFSATHEYPLPELDFPHIGNLRTADIDGDGDTDLVGGFSNHWASFIVVVNTGGDLSEFHAHVGEHDGGLYAANSHATPIDLDGDGRSEIHVTEQSAMYVYPGQFILPGIDCNENGRSDACDIGLGESFDCDENGTPDECQTDCDADGMLDSCEPDADEDGIIDDCEADSDQDGVIDDRDQCPDADDTLDTDLDGTPDCLDDTPNGDTDTMDANEPVDPMVETPPADDEGTGMEPDAKPAEDPNAADATNDSDDNGADLDPNDGNALPESESGTQPSHDPNDTPASEAVRPTTSNDVDEGLADRNEARQPDGATEQSELEVEELIVPMAPMGCGTMGFSMLGMLLCLLLVDPWNKGRGRPQR